MKTGLEVVLARSYLYISFEYLQVQALYTSALEPAYPVNQYLLIQLRILVITLVAHAKARKQD